MSELTPGVSPVLGEDAGELEVVERDQVADLSLAMANQASRYIDIVSRHLDPLLYDNDEFAEAIKQLALRSRRARIRLLIIDARPLITTGHRLIDLASKLPSFIEIRAPARHHRGFNEAFLLADNIGYIHRQFSDRFEASIDFADRSVSANLRDRFSTMWERATPEVRFRRLHI